MAAKSWKFESSPGHHYPSIKTLPTTLPEPSSMDRGPRTGVTGAGNQSDLHLCGAGGPLDRGQTANGSVVGCTAY